jgi:predicted AAA+ superfamily ATPase
MNDKLIKRKAIADLLGWFKAPNRKPLILRGARQVGKSTTVQEFARSAGLKLYELNLERHLHLDSAFSSLSIQKILIELEGVLKQRLSPEGSLLFLDEIQATPHGLAALRYFYEETEFAVIAAGSLLEFALGRKGLSMPVGRVEYFYLGPLSFEEFLLALGEDYLIELIQTASLPEQVSTTPYTRSIY